MENSMYKLVLLIGVIVSLNDVEAQSLKSSVKNKSVTTFVPYLFNSSYDENSHKKSTSSKGMFINRKSEDLNLSVNIEMSEISTDLENYEQVSQSAYALGISGISKEGWKHSIVGNFITSDSDYIWESLSSTFSFGKYKGYDSYFGTDISYTFYTPPRGSNFNVAQLAPVKEWYFKNLIFRIQPRFMKVSGQEVTASLPQDVNGFYSSLSLSPTLHFGRISIGGTAVLGEERFSVKKDGFVITNSPALYKKQMSGFFGIKIKNIYLKGTVGQNTFLPYGGENESTSNYTVFSLSFSF